MIKVDAAGLSCPEPVILTKNAIAANPSEVLVVVDNNVAKENVTRFLESNGYTVSVSEKGEELELHGKK